MRLPSSLQPLRHRAYARLFFGGMVSSIGSWMQTIAVGAMVQADTGRTVWAGIVALASFLPMGVLAPVGGALADRLDRRRFIIGADLVQVGLASALAALAFTGEASPVRVTAIVFVQGCLIALILPFMQAVLPELVPREDLLAAASLNALQYNLGRVLGPVLGALVTLAGFGWAFVVNAASFLAVVIALLGIRMAPPPRTEEGTMLARISAGARVALAEPGCRAALTFVGLAAFLAAPFIALIPAVARVVTDGSVDAIKLGTGILTTAQGVGAVVGALLITPLALRFGRRRLLVGYLVATPLALIGYGAMPNLLGAAVALFVVGALYIGILSGMGTVLQIRAPLAYRGRVMSLNLVALGTLYPIGGLVQGAVADAIGLARTTALFALVMLGAVVTVVLLRPRLVAALDDPEEPAEPAAGFDVVPTPGR